MTYKDLHKFSLDSSEVTKIQRVNKVADDWKSL